MASGIDTTMSGAGVGSVGLVKDARAPTKKDDKDTTGLNFKDALAEQFEKSESVLTQQADKAASKIEGQERKSSEKPMLKFSNHALERMNTRGIHFSPEQITKIEQGMQKAGDKGAKEALVLADDSALIVSLKNNTVVTVMDKSMLRENVFTNIDSTVFV